MCRGLPESFHTRLGIGPLLSLPRQGFVSCHAQGPSSAPGTVAERRIVNKTDSCDATNYATVIISCLLVSILISIFDGATLIGHPCSGHSKEDNADVCTYVLLRLMMALEKVSEKRNSLNVIASY